MEPLTFRQKAVYLARRSGLLRALRDGFYDGGFIEVSTNVKIPGNAPEEYIESVACGKDFLRTSPELAMKQLVCAGMEKIFQIGPAFRAEERGRKHREEFTILEYYSAGWDYMRLAEFTLGLLQKAAMQLNGSLILEYDGSEMDFSEADFITVDEAFRRYAGVSAFEADRDGTFDELMVLKVEPQLGRKHPEFLIDYPVSRAALARVSEADNTVAERGELYIRGLELGNAFGELTDAVEQRKRFEEALRFRESQGMLEYPMPEEFLQALADGMPEASGCAIGFDRLAMVFCNTKDIADVIFE